MFMVSFLSAQFWTLDFESASGYTTSIIEFTDGSGDYWLRTDGSDISETYIDPIGTYFFAGMDIDGEGATLPVFLDIDDIDINGQSNIELTIYLAEADDGSNQDWDPEDYLHIGYDIDNTGSFTPALWVESEISTGYNGAPKIDTDFDGVGDGIEITNTFVQFTTSIPATGDLLDLQIEFNLNSGDEDIAIDHLQLFAAGGPVPPSITDITHTPVDITSSTTVTVSANVEEGDAALANVELRYNTTNDFNSYETINMSLPSRAIYSADTDIPAQADGTTVYYLIYAEDVHEESTTSAVQSYTVTDPAITLTSPNGGESWIQGDTKTITWDSNMIDADATVRLYLAYDYQGELFQEVYGEIGLGETTNSGSYTWEIPADLELRNDYRIWIQGPSNVEDFSDADFSITAVPTATLPYSADFEAGFEDIYTYSASGDQAWEIASYGNPGDCAKMSGFDSGQYANVDWMILPALDLTGLDACYLNFDEAINYTGTVADEQVVYVSTNYSGLGDPSLATWNELTIGGRSPGNSWSYFSIEPADLSAYLGESSVHIGFKYTSTTDVAGTWEIDNISVAAPAAPGTGSGSSTGGADATVEVEPINIGGDDLTPQVVVTPPTGEAITVDVVVAGSATNPGAPYTNLSYTVNITGNVGGETLTIVLDYSGYTGTPAHIYYWAGGWMAPASVAWNTPGANQVTITIPFPVTRDGSTEIVLGDDNPLPVTLTNFMALELEANYVQLSWSVESESNLYGYYLYRALAESDEMSKISNIITANNLPQAQTYEYVDYEAVAGNSYDYYLESIDLDGSSTLYDPIRFSFAADEEEDNPYLPEELQALHNYPNPFNPSTTIKFSVPTGVAGENAQLHIFNTKGQKVTTLLQENLPSGNHSVTWLGKDSSGKEVNSGIYFYQLQIGSDYSEMQKMVLIK